MQNNKGFKLAVRSALFRISKLPPRITIFTVMIAIGLVTLIATKAATPTTSIQPEVGTRSANVSIITDQNASGSAIKFGTTAVSCGNRVQNYTYQVPFGNAVWNQPVCNLPHHPQSADYANRFYKWANLNDGAPSSQGLNGYLGVDVGIPKPTLTDPDGLSGLFSRNVYYASDATTNTQIQAFQYYSNLDGINLPYQDPRLTFPDTYIPWNPNWLTGEGGDNEIVILDNRPGPTLGRMYAISGYKRNLAAISQCGPFFRDRICTYNVVVGRDLNGNYIDYRTYENFLNERGVGLAMYATLVTPEEVIAGEIRHAIGVAIPNTAIGPICTKAQQGTSAEGQTCGTAVAPAGQFEWGGITDRGLSDPVLNALYTQDKLIPEGMRFAINITDAQIDAWIQSQSKFTNDPKKANTARIFARALRDYGMIIADTNGAMAQTQVAGSANPVARQQWASVGMDSDDDVNILQGLITSSNLYVVDPPTVTCKDGTVSKYFCQWTSARYGN